jgi:hypothetical protein
VALLAVQRDAATPDGVTHGRVDVAGQPEQRVDTSGNQPLDQKVRRQRHFFSSRCRSRTPSFVVRVKPGQERKPARPTTTEESPMRYISIYTHKPSNAGPTQEHIASMNKLIEDGKKEGWLITTEGVSWDNKGTRVQSTGGKISVTDGPFAEAKEVIGGYALLQVKSKEEALALSRRFLAVAGDGTCELHQLFEM